MPWYGWLILVAMLIGVAVYAWQQYKSASTWSAIVGAGESLLGFIF